MSLNRRNKVFWEPIYDKGLNEEFGEGLWSFENQTGPRKLCFRPEEGQNETRKVKNVAFQECDFRGTFNYRIVFVNCTFEKCDFAESTFNRAKFTTCTFSNTTFSMCNLLNCELRSCSFSKIGFSGNETQLDKTLITNPSEFISGGETNVSDLPVSMSPFVQKLRFEVTKSTLARSLMVTLANEGSEKTYYDGVKVSTTQDCKAKASNSILDLIKVKNNENISIIGKLWPVSKSVLGLIGSISDLIILRVFGMVNSWGSSVARPSAVGLGLIFFFGLVYSRMEGIEILKGAEKATEILLLFGYTKHSSLVTATNMQIFQLWNALLGVFWYVVTIPTIVNKLTRVRG